MEEWKKAGKIAREALNYGKELLKENAKIVEIAEKVEEKIRELGGVPAFPVSVSLNNIAAHYTPLYNDATILKKGDLVKLDVGSSINGAIADTALTVEINSSQHKELIKASREALNQAVKIAGPNTSYSEIGKTIQETITSYGFSPIKNLSGHGISRYEVHSGKNVPNHDNNNQTILKVNQVIAIEPFATKGVGLVKEGSNCDIYKLENLKAVRDRNAREVLSYIEKEFKTLPFAKRWIVNKFGLFKTTLAINILTKENILRNYTLLPESSGNLVSQAEHTLMITENGNIVTTGP